MPSAAPSATCSRPPTRPPDQKVVLQDEVRRLSEQLTAESDAVTLSLAAQILSRLASSE
jgi:hypothetical protein